MVDIIRLNDIFIEDGNELILLRGVDRNRKLSEFLNL